MNISKFLKQFVFVYGGMFLSVIRVCLELTELITRELLNIVNEIKVIGIKLTK